MRDKDWLVKVLEQASKRVEEWPEWKKSFDLQNSEQQEKQEDNCDEPPQARCA